MKEWLIRILIDFEIFYDKILSWFYLDETFWKVFYIYRLTYKNYFINLFFFIIKTLISKNFWISLFYNKNDGIIISLFLLLFFAPIFRFIIIIIKGIFSIILDIYRIFINFIFDLMLKYLNFYAIKFRIIYHTTVVEEVNELREVALLIGFKQKFLNIFKARKEVNIDGLIYKEEWFFWAPRVFMNFILFFIWSLPSFFSFVSYLVRLFFKLLSNYFRVFFWYFSNKILKLLRILDRKTWPLKYYYRKLKYFIFLKKVIRIKRKLKRRNIIQVFLVNNLVKKLLIKLYKDVSYFFRLKNYSLWLKVKKLRKNFKKNNEFFFLKKKQAFYNYYKYFLLYNKDINEDHYKSISNINLYYKIYNKINDKIINRLKYIDYDFHDDHEYNDYIKYYFLTFKQGTFLHMYNYYTIFSGFHSFIGKNVNNYMLFKSKFKFYKKFKLRILKIKFWYWANIYLDYVVNLQIIIYFIFSRIYKYLYLFFSFIYYLLYCFFHFVYLFLKFFWYLFLIIFFGKER